jgi:hypothetical protein
MYRRAFILIMILSLSISVQARIINIPADYPTIQAGIDAAVTGDTVMVAPGTYTETLGISNKNILLTSSYGIDSTHIMGRLTIGPNVDTMNIIRGFYFGPLNVPGAPLVINNCSSIIEGNKVQGNSDLWGINRAVILSNSNGFIRDNIIGGTMSLGASTGIESTGGYPIIERNMIYGCESAYSDPGGTTGIYMGSGILRNNLIFSNLSIHFMLASCDGVVASGGPYQLLNNTIFGNADMCNYDPRGAGLVFSVLPQGDSTLIRNNIIAFNHCAVGVSAGILDSAWAGWDYNLVFGNDSIDYAGMQPGPHDIQADPLFVDTASHDFHLQPNSPCIDAGDPNSPLDPDGTRADIGAYYFDQAVGINDGKPTGPYQFELHQNYPNPFNAQTIISYELSKQSIVSLRIMSITGQFVIAIAKNETQNAGKHQYLWEGRDKNGRMVSTGIYFYELYVDDYRESKAMIMIK